MNMGSMLKAFTAMNIGTKASQKFFISASHLYQPFYTSGRGYGKSKIDRLPRGRVLPCICGSKVLENSLKNISRIISALTGALVLLAFSPFFSLDAYSAQVMAYTRVLSDPICAVDTEESARLIAREKAGRMLTTMRRPTSRKTRK